MTPKRARYETRPLSSPVKKLVKFTVVGSGPFPFDMLRYDSCWPESGSQTHAMLADRGGERNVHLIGLREPTVQRWESFRWRMG